MKAEIRRRDFLELAGKSILALGGLLGVGGLVRLFSYEPADNQLSQFDLGLATDFPSGSRTVIPQASAILIHSPDGFRALSLICPHLGCQVKQVESGFACPCHGSQFNPDGNLKRGPADKPMRTLRVEVTSENRLILHTNNP
jgi:cytochrome b6-f complex iron-sulfur subunit